MMNSVRQILRTKWKEEHDRKLIGKNFYKEKMIKGASRSKKKEAERKKIKKVINHSRA
jgi:hypothetical protein